MFKERVKEAPDLKLQVISSDVLHNSLHFSTISITGNIVADDNNKQSACVSKSGT